MYLNQGRSLELSNESNNMFDYTYSFIEIANQEIEGL